MAGRRLATWGGVAAIGGGAYYLYSAGGDPKLAEKKLERMQPDFCHLESATDSFFR